MTMMTMTKIVEHRFVISVKSLNLYEKYNLIAIAQLFNWIYVTKFLYFVLDNSSGRGSLYIRASDRNPCLYLYSEDWV